MVLFECIKCMLSVCYRRRGRSGSARGSKSVFVDSETRTHDLLTLSNTTTTTTTTATDTHRARTVHFAFSCARLASHASRRQRSSIALRRSASSAFACQ